MRKIYTLVFALMVLLSVTMSAAALESKTIFRQNGVAAVASWSDETPDGTTFTDLQADETNGGTDVFVFINTPTTFKFGSILTQEDVFDINNKFTTATLSPVQMSLSVFNSSTGEFIGEETITIQAQWTGVGDLTKSSSKFMSKSGEFTAKFSDSSIIRDASATGSINGQELGISDFAELIKFKSASMTMEK
jgi:hypothetical protein